MSNTALAGLIALSASLDGVSLLIAIDCSAGNLAIEHERFEVPVGPPTRLSRMHDGSADGVRGQKVVLSSGSCGFRHPLRPSIEQATDLRKRRRTL